MIKMTWKGCSHRTLRGDRIKLFGGNAAKGICGRHLYMTERLGGAVHIVVEEKCLLAIMTSHRRHQGCQGSGITKKTMEFHQKQ